MTKLEAAQPNKQKGRIKPPLFLVLIAFVGVLFF